MDRVKINQHLVEWNGVALVRSDEHGKFFFVSRSGKMERVRPEPITAKAIWSRAREEYKDDETIAIGTDDFADVGQRLWYAFLKDSSFLVLVGHRNGSGEIPQIWAGEKIDSLWGERSV